MIEDGITGFAAATDDEFIARVIKLTEDSQLRQRMAAAARAATSNRTWEDVLSNLYNHYQELCESEAVEVAGRARAGHLGEFPKQKAKSLGYATSDAKQEW